MNIIPQHQPINLYFKNGLYISECGKYVMHRDPVLWVLKIDGNAVKRDRYRNNIISAFNLKLMEEEV